MLKDHTVNSHIPEQIFTIIVKEIVKLKYLILNKSVLGHVYVYVYSYKEVPN